MEEEFLPVNKEEQLLEELYAQSDFKEDIIYKQGTMTEYVEKIIYSSIILNKTLIRQLIYQPKYVDNILVGYEQRGYELIIPK